MGGSPLPLGLTTLCPCGSRFSEAPRRAQDQGTPHLRPLWLRHFSGGVPGEIGDREKRCWERLTPLCSVPAAQSERRGAGGRADPTAEGASPPPPRVSWAPPLSLQGRGSGLTVCKVGTMALCLRGCWDSDRNPGGTPESLLLVGGQGAGWTWTHGSREEASEAGFSSWHSLPPKPTPPHTGGLDPSPALGCGPGSQRRLSAWGDGLGMGTRRGDRDPGGSCRRTLF